MNRKKLVVAALGANLEHINEIYSSHIRELCETLDFVLLMTYDYNEKHATSFGASENLVMENVQNFLKRKCLREKIILGFSNYGKNYRLKRSTKNGIGAQAVKLKDVEYRKVKF